ncbi:ArsR/SmtB family transcription factor [Streptomyces sp. NPDC006879]|uniref:ArsR/SmtB family transcription factor n=1 Tax=Streptomyces sp. NPDC006879 TaxID=3364767 RepID=UPI00367A141A
MSTAVNTRGLAHPELAEIRLDAVLHALSDPIRRQIVCALAEAERQSTSPGPVALGCSAFELPVTKSTSTHHFRVLRESGVIRQHYRGTAKLNDLRRSDLERLFPGLLDGILVAAGAEEQRLARPGS